MISQRSGTVLLSICSARNFLTLDQLTVGRLAEKEGGRTNFKDSVVSVDYLKLT